MRSLPDLDSLCSAVMLAYVRSNTPPQTLHIPLSNIPREDLRLRMEMGAILRHAGLSFGDLITLSDLPELSPDDSRWILVDHNALTGQLKKYTSRIVGCIDHHVDEGIIPMDASLRVIETCGSCMSLVINECRAAWDAMDKLDMEPGAESAAVEDTRLAKLGLGPILVDTVNMTAEQKIRPKDRSAVEFLESKIHESAFDKTQYNDELAVLKEDISAFGLRDIFRKDYKEWEEDCGLKLGLSSVVRNLDYLISKAVSPTHFLDEFGKYARERGLDLAGITTASAPNGEFQRNLLLWGMNDRGVAALKRFLDKAGHLELEPWRNGALDDGNKRRAWRQRELRSSRKKLAPALREALNEVGRDGRLW